MYDRNLNIIHADKNIIHNRKRAILNILKFNRTYGGASNTLIKHYFKNNMVLPVWCVIHTLSLGDVLAIFNMFKKSDRNDLCKMFFDKTVLRYKEISKISILCNEIRIIRNVMNHYEPVIPLLLEYLKNGKEDEIYAVIRLLKSNYKKGFINETQINFKTEYSPLIINSYNRKQVTYIKY